MSSSSVTSLQLITAHSFIFSNQAQIAGGLWAGSSPTLSLSFHICEMGGCSDEVRLAMRLERKKDQPGAKYHFI